MIQAVEGLVLPVSEEVVEVRLREKEVVEVQLLHEAGVQGEESVQLKV